MDSYYCKNCEAIALRWNVISKVRYATEHASGIYTSDGEEHIVNRTFDREDIENCEEITDYVCIECGYSLEDIYTDDESGMYILKSLDAPLYQTYPLLPIKYKCEDFTKTDIELAVFEFKIVNS